MQIEENDQIILQKLNEISKEVYRVELIKKIKNVNLKIELLKKLSNDNYKTEIILTIKNEKLRIELIDIIVSQICKAKIINTIEDDEIKVQLLEEIDEEDARTEVIKRLKKDEVKVEFLKKISNEECKAEIIKSIKDKYIKLQLLEKLEFAYHKEKVIETVTDKEYIKQYIKSIKEISSTTLMTLIKATQDNDFIEKCVTDESMNLTAAQRIRLITENIKKCELLKEIFSQQGVNNKYKINLSEGMTIGIEIEAEGMLLETELFDKWLSRKDDTLKNGIEVVSSVLTGSEEDIENIYTVCNMLNKAGCTATDRCGAHVHIGADHLTSAQSLSNLILLWGNLEKTIYLISNAPGDVTRYEGIVHYAKPISGKIEKAIEEGKINLKDEDDLDELVDQIKKVQGEGKYYGINFLNIKKKEKNTIEFRLSNGTINPETWIQNINLFGGIISASERLSKIQKKSEEDRTDEEIEYLKTFEKIKSLPLDEEEKLSVLLDLVIKKEDREIYIKRYEVNKSLLSNVPKVETALNQAIAKKPIDGKRTESDQER